MDVKIERYGVWIAAGAGLAALAGVAGFAPLPFEPWLWSVLLIAVIGGGLVIAAALIRPIPDLGVGPLTAVVALAVAFRVATLFSDHMTCTDAARYHWDGKVLASGINPYAHAPDDEELDTLRTSALDRLVNMPSVRTPYPPLAELLFLAAYRLSPESLVGYQLICLALELCTWLLLIARLRRLGLPDSRILLAAWAPILVIAGYLPGHSDVLGLPLLTLLVIAALDERPVLAGLGLAGACLVKPIAIVLVPAVARELGVRRTAVFLAVAGLALAAVYTPLFAAGASHFRPMFLMAKWWAFNGTWAALLDALLPMEAARIVSMSLLAAFVLLGAAAGEDFLSRALMALAAAFSLSPVLFPWYVIWAVPLLVLRPDPALLALAALVPITDIAAIDVYVHDAYEAPLWSTLAAFIPFYALLFAGAARRWGMFRGARWLRARGSHV